jgi:transcriptional accessory protein Tex/SPT6
MTHADQIASQLEVKPSQVTAVINLLDEGNTVPFIARYRKEMTGSLDDEQIRIIASRNEMNGGNKKGWNRNVQPFWFEWSRLRG